MFWLPLIAIGLIAIAGGFAWFACVVGPSEAGRFIATGKTFLEGENTGKPDTTG